VNWRRGFHRLWISFSIIWVVASTSALIADYEHISANFGDNSGLTLFLIVASYVIGPPVVIYAIGWTIAWIGRGFTRNP
jgi:hypothetical protein